MKGNGQVHYHVVDIFCFFLKYQKTEGGNGEDLEKKKKKKSGPLWLYEASFFRKMM